MNGEDVSERVYKYSIRVDAPTVTFLVFGYTIGAAVIIANALEIHIIRKKWQKITDFELILFNLAIADAFTGVFYLSLAGMETYIYVQKKIIKDKFLVAVYFHIIVSVIVSVNFVILIGTERLFAIRLPLQHRMFHMKRRRVCGAVASIWIITIILCAVVIATDQKLTNEKGQIVSFGSLYLGYVYGAVLTFQSVVVLVLYTGVAVNVLRHRSRFIKLNRNTIKATRKTVTKSWKKERTILIVCVLVVTSFLICTTPYAIRMYRGESATVENLLLLSNSLINPFIYFFKMLIEKRHFRKRALSARKGITETIKMSSTKKENMGQAKENPVFENGVI
ncbi:tachykinin-like peptides receptor 86C [Rhopilema esculentum]|uniref:tachykinin-like peptides receptor 86C n=1 Tax=Rhopilema esculentum TaxID=499914 RepID=UPI0031E0AA09|eukprot:gene4443-20686_t